MGGKVERHCIYCGKIFFVYPSDIKPGEAIYCSRSCHYAAQANKIVAECETCGRQFETVPSAVKRGGGKYCSVECRAKAKDTHIEKPCERCGQVFRARKGESEHGRAKYCSNECRSLAHRKRISFTCINCAKETEIPQCREDTRFCSYECLENWRERERRVVQVCMRCGRQFDVYVNRLENGRGKFCSKACQSGYERARVTLTCQKCGKEFRAFQSDVDTGQKFCSRACYSKYRGETLIEILIREELERRGISYEREVQIRRYSVDFLLTEDGIVIECDGRYWHSFVSAILRDRRKDEYLKSLGYQIVRLPEQEIRKSPSECIDRVLRARNK